MGKINKQDDSNPSEVIERKNTAQKVRSLFQSAPDVFVITDNNGKILTANNQLEKVFGYSEDEIIDKNLCFLFPERFRAKDELNIISCFKNSSSQTIGSNSELSGLRKNGSEFFIEVSMNRLNVDNKETVIAIIRDITEKKKSNDNLQLSEQRYQRLTNISPVGIFNTDVEGKTTYVNPRWCEISGLSFEDALDYGWLNAVHPEDREKLIDSWEKSVKSLSDSIIDYRFLRNDGSIAWVMGKAVPETNLSGEIIGYIGTIIDITERKQAEEALRREQILLRTLIDNIPDVIYIKDKSCRKIIANLADIKNMGLKNESDVIGKSDFDLFPKEIAEEFFKDDQFVIQSGTPILNREELLIDSGGKQKWLLTSKVPLTDERGEISGLVGIGHDITEKKKVEDAFKESEFLLKVSQRVAGLGHYTLDISSGKWESGEILNEIFGIDETYRTDVAGWSNILHPDHKERMKAYLSNDVITQHKRFDSEYKIVRVNDKQVRWVYGIGELKFDENGKPIKMIGTIQDITDRKKAEKELRESEERFRSLYENSTLGIYRTTPDGKILLANPALVKILGFDSFNDLAKVNLSKEGFETPDERTRFIERVEREGEIKGLEFNWKSKNGNTLYIRESAKAVRDINGKTLYYDGTIEDITEKKIFENALIKSQSQLSQAAEIAQLGPWEYDAIKDQFIFNDYFYKLFHTTIEQVGSYAMSPTEYANRFLFPEDVHLVAEEMKLAMESTDPGLHRQLEHRIKYADGKPGYVTIDFFIVKDNNGRTIRTYGVNQDITERKKAEKNALILSKAMIQSPVSILITDAKGNIEYVNPTFTKVTGYSQEEVTGRDPGILNSGHHSKEFFANLWDTILSGKDFACEMYNKKKNGELFWENVVVSSIVDEKGIITHFVAVKEDITEKKKIVEELIVAKEKAEEMNRLKSSFLANMSHELRTPLIGIIGFSEFLSNDLEDPGLKEMAETIFNSSKRLSETLNLILDLSKIEADNIPLIPEVFDVAATSLEIVNSFKEYANKKGIYLKTVFEMPKFTVNLNKQAYHSILNNLVNNAIKFTHSGGVTVDLSADKIDGKNFVSIKVIDTGIGISKENHDLIFEEFRQVSEGLERNFEGSGLGLNITKKFLEKLKGTLSIESELGKGTIFTVKLPLSEDLQVAASSYEIKSEEVEEKKAQLDTPSILIVDDDENIFKLVKNHLKLKFNVSCVESAYDALELVKEKKFDVIFMDINLKKGVDGKQATLEIRKIHGYENTPIVACTAYAMVGDKEEFLSAGCSHYLSKPFSKEEILFLLNEILSPSVKQII